MQTIKKGVAKMVQKVVITKKTNEAHKQAINACFNSLLDNIPMLRGSEYHNILMQERDKLHNAIEEIQS